MDTKKRKKKKSKKSTHNITGWKILDWENFHQNFVEKPSQIVLFLYIWF